METNKLPLPEGWYLIGQGVLARNKNNPNARYYGELFDTPNGFIHIITQYDVEPNGDLTFHSTKAHILKPDSTVLYQDSQVSYVVQGNPEQSIRNNERAE